MLFIRSTTVRRFTAAALFLAAAVPAVARPLAKSSKAVPAAQYECQKCHMRYSAAVAKKDKFVDPMDGGKLTPVKASPKKSPAAKSSKPAS